MIEPCVPEPEKANGWTRWIQPIRKGYRMQCCDCDLVHVMEFRVKQGRAQFRAKREDDNLQTLQEWIDKQYKDDPDLERRVQKIKYKMEEEIDKFHKGDKR